MAPPEKNKIAEDQRRTFNELVDVFDVPQPGEVIERLRQVVAAVELRPGEVVLDVGTGAGVLIPLIDTYRPSLVISCDLAENMLARVRKKYPHVRTYQSDISELMLDTASVDVIFMNAMYGNIADKPAACRNAARMLRPGGRFAVSHPEGRDFIDELRRTSDLFIEPFPTREDFEAMLTPLGLDITVFRDEPKLYLMVARRKS